MRIALVGAGGMGTCHYMNYRHIEEAQVVALVGRGERDRAHAEQWGLPLYTCVDEANRREQIDLFDVCVPTYLHKAIVLEAYPEAQLLSIRLDQDDGYAEYEAVFCRRLPGQHGNSGR